nr:tsf [Erythrotrichia welwitschii]
MKSDISAKVVKELRDKTGAGMMDCKKALQSSEGNMEDAIESLRLKGLASADKKALRKAAEGLIDSYIHTGSKLGVLVEVNCETDFVARREEFQILVKNIAMQIAASPSVNYISIEDIPQEIIEAEKQIENKKDDISSKPDNIKEKIVHGRIQKRLKEMSLLDQSFIKNQDITIEGLIKQKVALLGENIQIARFQRFTLGSK